jgi:hypothetical protein
LIWKEQSLHHCALLLVAPQNDVVVLELGASAVDVFEKPLVDCFILTF